MLEADHELRQTLLEDVLDPTIVREAVDEAVRLVSAIASGGMLDSLLAALREREMRLEGPKDPDHARPIVSSLLIGRVTITPAAKSRQWELRGEGTIACSAKRSSRWDGAPDRSRTCGLRLRRPTLYPAELRARVREEPV